jgi:hypothetical protein
MVAINFRFYAEPGIRTGMLIPFNFDTKRLMDVEDGDTIYDKDGTPAILIGKAQVESDSDIADCISRREYRQRSSSVLRRMENVYGFTGDKLIYLIIEVKS